MANSIISMSSRIWNLGCLFCLLLVITCYYVCKHVITSSKDSLVYLSARFNAILRFAIPASEVEAHDICNTSQNDGQQDNPDGKTGIYCPKPIRTFPTHRVVLEPESFEDWYVDISEAAIDQEELSSGLIDYRDVEMSPTLDDEAPSPEPLIIQRFTPPGTSTPESETSSPARRDTPYPGLGGDNNDEEESDEAGSPTPFRLVLPKSFPTRHDTPWPEFE